MTTTPHRPAWHPAVWATALGLLLAAAIAPRLSAQFSWTPGDHAAAALVLLGGAAVFELAARLAPARRRWLGAGMLGLIVLLWAELAVGLFS